MRTLCGMIVLTLLLGGGRDARAQASAQEYRTWTSTSGSTVEARLVFNYGESIRLASRDGGQFAIKTAFLSAPDREYLRTRGIQKPSREDPAPRSDKIDINRASFDQLKFLPRIGNMLAQRIIDGRPYDHPSDLLKIEGIGMRTYELIKDEVVALHVKK